MTKAKTPKTTKTTEARPKRSPAKTPRPKPVPKFRTGYVALIGRPNAGKSTLLNAMLGQKLAIISDKPQTTRLSILGIHTTPKGQIIFIDNPGIHKPLHNLNKRMMSFVYASLETADLVCLLVDAQEKFGHGDEFVLEILSKITKPVFLLINKVDAGRKDTLLPLIGKYKDLAPFREIIPISALKGINLDVLERLVFESLPAAEKLYGDDDVTDQSERFLIAEIIREKILSRVEDELPWATAVLVDRIERRGAEEEQEEGGVKEGASEKIERAPDAAKGRPSRLERRDRPLVYIKASIIVERDNHRKIVIGRQGKVIKIVGIEARREIEEILEARVYLELQVKVRSGWRDSADVLDLIEGQKRA